MKVNFVRNHTGEEPGRSEQTSGRGGREGKMNDLLHG